MKNDIMLNGISIRENDPRIIVSGILDSQPKEKSIVTSMGYTHGGRLSKTLRQELTASFTIGINESDAQERDAIYQSIRKWGRHAGYLTTGARENQRLYVETMEIKTSGKRQAETLAITFTAYAKPFWENLGAQTASVSTAATSGSTSLFAPGNADECTVDAEITAKGGTLNTLTVTVGNTSMSFTALGITANNKLIIAHRDDGLLIIKNGATSLMTKRTGASADDLIAEPGSSNAVSFSGNVTCTAKFSTRGRWL
ncbi:MAG TPA: hypothetical protein PKJ47_13810 [Candidatus Limiplasma sp.]|nr:hypothetical protein [Candidatus Limiplasma sp.]